MLERASMSELTRPAIQSFVRKTWRSRRPLPTRRMVLPGRSMASPRMPTTSCDPHPRRHHQRHGEATASVASSGRSRTKWELGVASPSRADRQFEGSDQPVELVGQAGCVAACASGRWRAQRGPRVCSRDVAGVQPGDKGREERPRDASGRRGRGQSLCASMKAMGPWQSSSRSSVPGSRCLSRLTRSPFMSRIMVRGEVLVASTEDILLLASRMFNRSRQISSHRPECWVASTGGRDAEPSGRRLQKPGRQARSSMDTVPTA